MSYSSKKSFTRDAASVGETTEGVAAGQADSSPASTAPLWDWHQLVAYFGLSSRKVSELRSAGLLPPAIVLGPRALRWIPSEVVAAVAALPRAQTLAEPSQLSAGKQAAATSRRVVRCK
jgi:predicted DNA-binding transcriptional regulator AlpA